MKKLKRAATALLAAVMLLAMNLPAFAAGGGTGFTDVAADAWYADGVEYVRDKGLMSGMGDGAFSPEADTSRGQIATILYRAAGSPDTDAGENFADENTISAYASTAVDWARGNGIINGKEGNRFDPNGSATRAQVAVILRNYIELETAQLDQPHLPAPSDAPSEASHSALVVYFSVPETTRAGNMTTEEDNSTVVIDGQVLGNTQYMAQVIAEETGGDIFRIEPVTPYPTDHSTLVDQASREQADNARPAIKGSMELDGYDTIFIGYPIWWSDMPQILYTFFDSYDLSGKTVIPFSTHGGSGFAGTPDTIRELEPDAATLDGLTISRDRVQDARDQIVDWVNGLDIA